MHRLQRQVRFTINPFLDDTVLGANSFCSKPAGEGLGLFLEIGVAVVGRADEDTGFVINVLDIDKAVRQYVVPVFADVIKTKYRRAEHIGIAALVGLLHQAQAALTGNLRPAILSDLSLKLNPYRKIAIDCEDSNMVYLSEKFEFAAMHKLWNDKFTAERNFQAFGKCANPSGHGHNYIVEVTVKAREEADALKIGEFEQVVDDRLINLIDHKNLNADVPEFQKTNPTIENLAVFAWQKLAAHFDTLQLHSITVWETDKTSCSYYG